jgi:hypothetical protein
MIASFAVRNWKSFRGEEVFSFAASKEAKKREHVFEPARGVRLLPVAGVFGPNASGKSNFISACETLRNLVLHGGTRAGALPYHPFKLDSECLHQPTGFVVEFVHRGKLFRYAVDYTRDEVISEELVELKNSRTVCVYRRERSRLVEVCDALDASLAATVMKATRQNVLFAHNAAVFNVAGADVVADWMRACVLILKDSDSAHRGGVVVQHNGVVRETWGATLKALGTGIEGLKSVPVGWETSGISEEQQQEWSGRLAPNQAVFLHTPDGGQRLLVFCEGGELVVHKLMTQHYDQTGREVLFDLAEESEGVRRMVDLLPALALLIHTPHPLVVFVDELDSSLHSEATQALLERFLTTSLPRPPAQLFFTTHDLMLMDQELFRRDELWLCDTTSDGSSHFTCFADYAGLHHTTKLRNLYLSGRTHGLPRIVAEDILPYGSE